MIGGILQPGYLPWLGFFEQLHRSDVFVIYDDVQYDKHSWRNRNRIKTASGPQWLTVPVALDFAAHPQVKDVRVDNKTGWRRKHLLSIRQNYSRAPFFKEHIGVFEEAFSREWDLLVDLDLHFIKLLAGALGLGAKRIVRSSELGVGGGKVERLVSICKNLGVDTFYEGAAGRSYLQPSDFEPNGIRLEFQDYAHPVYRQLHGTFVPYLSVVDLLFNCGPESLGILVGDGRKEATA
ncbi:MAG: WbqC family protein [Elusimicrobia bacterium]|nr:WbqC family protein [Elusimicrobiota bacterium]